MDSENPRKAHPPEGPVLFPSPLKSSPERCRSQPQGVMFTPQKDVIRPLGFHRLRPIPGEVTWPQSAQWIMGRGCLSPKAPRRSKLAPFLGFETAKEHQKPSLVRLDLGADETAGTFLAVLDCCSQLGKLSGATSSAERRVIQLPGIPCIEMCPGSFQATQEDSCDEHPQPLECRVRQGTRQGCSE